MEKTVWCKETLQGSGEKKLKNDKKGQSEKGFCPGSRNLFGRTWCSLCDYILTSLFKQYFAGFVKCNLSIKLVKLNNCVTVYWNSLNETVIVRITKGYIITMVNTSITSWGHSFPPPFARVDSHHSSAVLFYRNS